MSAQKCPKCNSDNLTMVGVLARCQACEAYFEPPSRPAPTAIPKIIRPGQDTRRMAEHFTTAGLIFGAFGVISGLMIVISLAEVDASGALIALYCVAGFLATAFGLLLLAQIIHIRANTER